MHGENVNEISFGREATRKETTGKTDVGGKVALKRILQRQDVAVCNGLIRLMMGSWGEFL
jgi:hypothetical protein